MLLYVVCTAGEFVWNEGGIVPATCYLLPVPYITMCDFFYQLGIPPAIYHLVKNYKYFIQGLLGFFLRLVFYLAHLP